MKKVQSEDRGVCARSGRPMPRVACLNNPAGPPAPKQLQARAASLKVVLASDNTLATVRRTGASTPEEGLASEQQGGAGVVADVSVVRYEHLANAHHAFVFTVICKDAQSLCTIRYPGCLQVTGYTEAEYVAQPLLWFTMIYADDREIVRQQIARLLQGETPPSIKHRIIHKDGTLRWVRNTSVPVLDAQGTLIAYDGLIVDISQSEFAGVEQGRQIAKLKTALAMFTPPHSILPICSTCKRIRDDDGYWQQMESYIAERFSGISFTHGICPECVKQLYPEYYQEVNRALSVSRPAVVPA